MLLFLNNFRTRVAVNDREIIAHKMDTPLMLLFAHDLERFCSQHYRVIRTAKPPFSHIVSCSRFTGRTAIVNVCYLKKYILYVL